MGLLKTVTTLVIFCVFHFGSLLISIAYEDGDPFKLIINYNINYLNECFI